MEVFGRKRSVRALIARRCAAQSARRWQKLRAFAVDVGILASFGALYFVACGLLIGCAPQMAAPSCSVAIRGSYWGKSALITYPVDCQSVGRVEG